MMSDEEKRKKADEILARGNEESVDVQLSGTDCAGSSCSACRWWVEDDHTLAPPPQRECRNEKFLHESGWPSAGDAAKSLTYQYYEGGQIWTGPDFGCVHFEPNSQDREPTK
jgi:hypothetical protein